MKIKLDCDTLQHFVTFSSKISEAIFILHDIPVDNVEHKRCDQFVTSLLTLLCNSGIRWASTYVLVV